MGSNTNVFDVRAVDVVIVYKDVYMPLMNSFIRNQSQDTSLISVRQILLPINNELDAITGSVTICFKIGKNTTNTNRKITLTGALPNSKTIIINQSCAANEKDPLSIPGNWKLTYTYTSDSADYNEDITFFDGLGYPEQIIQVQGSPNRRNIVTPVVYDNMMRDDAKSYLPYVSNKMTAEREMQILMKQYAYYWGKYDADDASYAYIEKQYESSALNRVLKEYNAGSIFRYSKGNGLIGSALKQKTDKHKTFDYLTNSANEVFKLYVGNAESSPLNVQGYYPQGTLYENVITNEDGQTSITFTDKSGNLVLQRTINSINATVTENIDTYYAYDDYGQRRWVISPEGSAQLMANTTLYKTSDIAKKYCYVYAYDGLGRQISKQMPGKSVEYAVYDRANRPVMMQDGALRQAGKWIIYKYDNPNRVTHEYLITDNRSRSTFQSLFDNAVNNDNSPNSIYSSTTKQLLRETRYDSYANSLPAVLAFEQISGITAETCDSRVTGNKTYEKTGILGSAGAGITQYVERAFYYDYMNRPIQTVEKNHLGGISRMSYKYDFTGNALALQESHTTGATGTADVKITEFDYDHRGRLLAEKTTVNDSDTALVIYEYDDIGQPVKQIYADTVHESVKYNIQGWITEKQAAYKGSGVKEFIFNSQLKYYDPATANHTPSYTGNITEWTWQHYENKPKTFNFTYDKLNRLASRAINSSFVGRTTEEYDLMAFTELGFTYDRNGNIKTLKRYGANDTIIVDNLEYGYNGNQLTALTGTTTAGYTYDSNGNMNYDGRRNVNINYNLLNLPYQVIQNSQAKATFTYIADGTKASAIDSAGKGFIYLGTMVYAKELLTKTLESASFGGGRINRTGTNSYDINYFITDHLGSTRVIVDNNGEIKEQKDFYPFGKEHENPDLITSTNRWSFNGKEKQTIKDLGWLDFSARMLETEFGRWLVPDPLAEKYYSISPYVYCMNNPLRFIDPDGKQPRIYVQSKGLGHVFVTVNKGKNTIIYSYGRYGSVGSSGITSGRFTPMGEGVLYRKTGDEAQKYLSEVQSEGKFSIYTINGADDHAVANFYDEQWNNGTRPTDENKVSYTDENAKVVDTYNLFDNNCVTKSIDGINNKDNILDYTDRRVAGTTYDGITYYQNVNINSPSRLKQYLDNMPKSNTDIVKIENPQEFIKKLQELFK
ncbi:MAG: DUF6443 domain-containing protein [Prevotellaceae bacterium]|jgi:RHS repeat-associated protein|nr:DUF6443 domain-containing protein [Prevotellaceae bacterium]